jgi:hypothetical protein
MPSKLIHDHSLHKAVYLTMSILYALECVGFDERAVEAGLAICYCLLCLF